MRRFIPLILAGMLLTLNLYAQDEEAGECIIKAKSCLDAGTVPQPFQELQGGTTRWAHNSPAISTGYYFVTNSSRAQDFWRPRASEYESEKNNVNQWITITSGPRVREESFWEDPARNIEGGYWFFRNPASNNGDVFDPSATAIIDSTDDAIAGPMRLGLTGGFRFNGIRYDSFYVSTNGLIALTNSRYEYNDDGNPIGYNRESMDWHQGPTIGRGRVAQASTDPVPDDYGWRYAVLGNLPTNTQGGIRRRGGTLDQISNPYKAAVIAPFFGDMHLSQYSKSAQAINPHGKVMYRRSNDARKMYISFFNIAPKSGTGGAGTTLNSPCNPYTGTVGQTTATSDLRPGDANYTAATAQVILNSADSSVTIIYSRFDGIVVNGNCNTTAVNVFRYNTTAGVRGFARHDNFNRKPAAQVSEANREYEQYTHHWIRGSLADSRPNLAYPRNQYAVRYKTWQNTLRVADIQYRVRNPKIEAVIDLDFTEQVSSSEVNNYELLAGEERIGAIQPVALIQNLSNDIQGSRGSNYVKQDLEFRARFSIQNQASGRTVFQKLTIIDSVCLAVSNTSLVDCSGDPNVKIRLVEVERSGRNYDTEEYIPTVDDPTAAFQFPGDGTNTTSGNPYGGVPSYAFVKVNFPPFEPSEFVDDHIGRLRARVIGVPQNALGDDLGDEWPFDDSTGVNLFVLKRLNSFYDDGGEFHLINGTPMPSVLKWVNIDAEMVSGDQVSKHPLPPRGSFGAQFVDSPPSKAWLPDKIDQARAFSLNSPVIKMNRLTLGQQEPEDSPGGDIIRSFPIDMRGRENSVLSISVQRTTYREDWERGFGDNSLIGPEPRAIFNNNDLNPYTNGRAASANPDEIVVELANNFVQSFSDKLTHVTNIDDRQWRMHFRRGDADEVTNMPALGLYGAGGYRVGFLESDPDSSLADATGAEFNGLRPNRYDDGVDEEYRKFFVAIPDTFVNFSHEVAENFRFRVRVMATNDRKTPQAIPDDADDFYVDNVKILFEDIEAVDIEVSSVKIKWPFTRVPATQATAVPVEVRVTNNTSSVAPVYNIKVKVYKGVGQGFDGNPIYCRTRSVSNHNPSQSIDFRMPSFNAKEAGPGDYRFEAIVLLPGDSDKDPRNDTTYFDWNIEFGDDIAYDPVTNPTNDASGDLGKPRGRGLNLFGTATGGTNNVFSYDNVQDAAGVTGGNGSGQIAMKFTLANADTLYGYKAFFGTLNQALDDIQFSLYEGEGNPQALRPEGSIFRFRGRSDLLDDSGDPITAFGEYVDYRLDEGIVLQPGTYWIAIAQLGETGLELGASRSRGGMRTTNVYVRPPDPVGASGIQLALHKEFRKMVNNNLQNDNYFAMENSKGSGEWENFMKTIGNPAYGHLHHAGTVTPGPNYTLTLTKGFWIPLLRPYFGEKEFGTDVAYEICADDIPVELAYFNGNETSKGLQLYWETKSEDNSRGFYVERKLNSQDGEDKWQKLNPFVQGRGAGTYAGKTQYDFLDSDIEPNLAYDYRLRQVDIDGAQDCKSSGIVTLEWTQTPELMVTQQAYPNPFMELSKFEIFNPTNDFVTVQILDLQGNVISTLMNEQRNAGNITLEWDARNQAGQKVSQGTYIYRVTTSNASLSGRLNYIAK